MTLLLSYKECLKERRLTETISLMCEKICSEVGIDIASLQYADNISGVFSIDKSKKAKEDILTKIADSVQLMLPEISYSTICTMMSYLINTTLLQEILLHKLTTPSDSKILSKLLIDKSIVKNCWCRYPWFVIEKKLSGNKVVIRNLIEESRMIYSIIKTDMFTHYEYQNTS